MWITNQRRALMATVAILSLVCAFLTGRLLRLNRPLPQIAATLEGHESQFSLQLTALLRERFPVGSNENELINFLDTEGFSPEWARANAGNSAVFVREGIICQKVVRVRWMAAETGKLTGIEGNFTSKCS